MFFWYICRGKSGLPILFLRHLRTTPLCISYIKIYGLILFPKCRPLYISHLKIRMGNFLYKLWKSLYFIWTTCSLGTDTCVLLLYFCLCASHVCGYWCVLVSSVCGWCVVLSYFRHRDEDERTWDVEQPEEQAHSIHRLGETGLLISAVPMSRKAMKEGWPGQFLTVGPQICRYVKRRKQDHNFCCVVLCVCVVKQR